MDQLSFYEGKEREFLSLKEAAGWASKYLKRNITNANISYLLQYGRIKKYSTAKKKPLISVKELKNYYDSLNLSALWENKKGLNWRLSFAEYKESERAKHVHRLHPYKGKFIPQLAEYFLDERSDSFKARAYFKKGDIALDPFCGSGTSLVQASELGLSAIGIDISEFNSLISNVKVRRNSIPKIQSAVARISLKLDRFQGAANSKAFESHLQEELTRFNLRHFPSPEHRRKVSQGEIDEKQYGREKERLFLPIYFELAKKYKIKARREPDGSFMGKWLLFPARREIGFIASQLSEIKDLDVKEALALVISRTIRSCRATAHTDLGTLKQPVFEPYYCRKHGKICKPLFTAKGRWRRYAADTLRRLREFEGLRTDTFQICLTGDSRCIDIYKELKKRDPEFARLLARKKIKGVFSSPPYVGLIDYHEQHAYAYEALQLKRKDEGEIGPLFKGQGQAARDSYIKGVSEVLKNCAKYFQEDYDIFLVANDKFKLYPSIAKESGMKIVQRFNRPVLNRAEKDRSSKAYSETIFHLKGK